MVLIWDCQIDMHSYREFSTPTKLVTLGQFCPVLLGCGLWQVGCFGVPGVPTKVSHF